MLHGRKISCSRISGLFAGQPEEALERRPVTDLELGLIVGQVVQRLQHQHLEHQRHVVRLAPGIALTLLLVDHFQQRAERLPVYDAIQAGQRIPKFLQLR
jgi:hypothetical protein